MRVLVVDVGGTNLKVAVGGGRRRLKIPSGPTMTARQMVEAVLAATKRWKYDVVSVGFPGPVVDGQPAEEPVNLGPGWVGFDYEAAFGRPVRFLNDAAMQALGSYRGGRMLFLGLGTGLGSAMVVDGVVVPLELARLPYRKGLTFEDWLGKAGLARLGRKRWRACVAEVTALFKHVFQVEYVVLGGGHAKLLTRVPEGARLGDNRHAITGGVRMWEPGPATPSAWRVAGLSGKPRPRVMVHRSRREARGAAAR